jgi:hypothetical protein
MRGAKGVLGLVLAVWVPSACSVASQSPHTGSSEPIVEASVDAGAEQDAHRVRACAPGELSCKGTCLDPSSDPANCGECGRVCPSSQTCTDGSCICASGKTLCHGLADAGPPVCADLSEDNENCGACGNACPAGAACQSGTCVCDPGYQLCTTVQYCQNVMSRAQCDLVVVPAYCTAKCPTTTWPNQH